MKYLNTYWSLIWNLTFHAVCNSNKRGLCIHFLLMCQLFYTPKSRQRKMEPSTCFHCCIELVIIVLYYILKTICTSLYKCPYTCFYMLWLWYTYLHLYIWSLEAWIWWWFMNCIGIKQYQGKDHYLILYLVICTFIIIVKIDW